MSHRHYGLDALKICAMLMVVIQHMFKPFVDKGIDYEMGGWGICLQATQALCYCAVDCFVMASGFVMCRREWKWKRILDVWGLVVFYSLILVGAAAVFSPGMQMGIRDFVGAVLPVSFRRYWFVTQYVALFFTMPILNVLLNNSSERQKCQLAIGGFVMLSLMPFVAGCDLFHTNFGFSYLWFIYCYLVGGIVAFLLPKIVAIRKRYLCTTLLVVMCMAVLGERIAHYLSSTYNFGGRFAELYCNYTSPCLFIEALCLLVLFARWNCLPSLVQKLCVVIAPSNFIVYIVHCNKEFYGMTNWSDLPLVHIKGGAVVPAILFMAVLLYSLIVCADLLRRTLKDIVVSAVKNGRAKK